MIIKKKRATRQPQSYVRHFEIYIRHFESYKTNVNYQCYCPMRCLNKKNTIYQCANATQMMAQRFGTRLCSQHCPAALVFPGKTTSTHVGME